MRIVGHGDSQSQPVAQHGRQWDNALPWQVGGMFDITRDGTGTRGTDTHRADGLIPSILLYEHQDSLGQCCHIIVDIRIVCRLKKILSQDIAPDIHDGECRLFQTDVNTYYTRFNLINGLY